MLLAPNLKQRIRTLEKCIDLVEALKDIQNYHGMFAVYSALNLVSVQRQKSAWKVTFSNSALTNRQYLANTLQLLKK